MDDVLALTAPVSVVADNLAPGVQDELRSLAMGARVTKSKKRSPHTLRAYARGWSRFQEWSAASGLRYLPADPAVLALYLEHLVEEGLGKSAVQATTSRNPPSWRTYQNRAKATSTTRALMTVARCTVPPVPAEWKEASSRQPPWEKRTMETLTLTLHKAKDTKNKVVYGTADGSVIQSVYIDKDALGKEAPDAIKVVISAE